MSPKEDATHKKGVSEEVDQEQEKAKEEMFPANQNNALRDQIALNVDKKRAEDMGKTMEELGYEGEEKEEKTPKEEEAAPKEEDKETSAEEKETPVEEKKPEDDEMIPLKVYGEEKLYPKKEVDEHGGVVAYQKELASQKGFERNAQKEKELKEWEQKLNEREQRLSSKDKEDVEYKTPEDDKSEGKPMLDDEKRKEKLSGILYSIQYGDEKEGLEALMELVDLQASMKEIKDAGGSNVDEIIKEVEFRRIVKDNDNRFKEEFPQLHDGNLGMIKRVGKDQKTGNPISADVPIFLSLAWDEVDRLVKDEGLDDTDYTTWKKAGDNITSKFPKVFGKKEETSQDDEISVDETLKQKKIIKKKIDNPPGAGATPATQEKEETPQTEEESRAAAIQMEQARRDRFKNQYT